MAQARNGSCLRACAAGRKLKGLARPAGVGQRLAIGGEQRHVVRVLRRGGLQNRRRLRVLGQAAQRARLLLRASPAAPRLALLAYYETGAPARPYRLLRHVFQFHVKVRCADLFERASHAIVPKRMKDDE